MPLLKARSNQLRQQIAIAAWIGLFGANCCFGGTVVTDGSVGAKTTLTGPTFNIPASLGTQKGANLFQSFKTLTLDNGETASFGGPGSVSNVIARVTGGTASNINGTLQCTIPNANFFLINPSGVIFGPDAALDVKGSFVVTTADYLKLADGKHVDAVNLSDSVLTSAAPAAFGFMSAAPKPVTMNGPALAVPAAKTLSVVGGNIQITNGLITTPGGRVNLVSTASPGELTFDATSLSANIDLTPAPPQLGNIMLTQGTFIQTDGPAGGRVSIRGASLNVNQSVISASTTTSAAGSGIDVVVTGDLNLLDSLIVTDPAGAGRAGPINITAGNIVFDPQGDTANLTGLSARAATGSGGDITVDGSSLKIVSGAQISTDTTGSGAAGNISVNASQITLDGGGIDRTQSSDPLAGTGIFARTAGTGKAGAAGIISINADSLSVTNGAAISAESDGDGFAGSVTITGGSVVVDDMDLNLLTGIFADSSSSKAGPGNGQITINVSSLSLMNGATVSASAFGASDAGTVNITTSGALTLSDQPNGTGTIISTATFFSGNAGTITIQAGSIDVGVNSLIAAATAGTGKGGAINVTANTLNIDGGAIQVESVPSMLGKGQIAGDAGSISVNAGTLMFTAGGTLNAGTAGPGHGGTIAVNATTISADATGTTQNTGIFADSAVNPGNVASIGPAGTISITGGSLTLYNGASISASTAGQGTGGNITTNLTGALSIDGGTSPTLTGIETNAATSGIAGDINVTAASISLSNNSTIASDAGQTGSAGNINVTANSLQITTGALISSDTSGTGAGGNVNVHVAGALLIDGQFLPAFTGISADTLSTGAGGNGGTVTVAADTLTVQNSGQITSNTTGLGNGGNVNVTANTIVLNEAPSNAFTGISALSESAGAGGRGGDVTVNATTSLEISNGARISSETFGLGNGGNVMVTAGSITIENPGDELNAGIVADSDSSGPGGQAGNINVTANSLLIASTGEISSSTFGLGNSGNITINAKQMTLDVTGGSPATIALNSESVTGVVASSQSSAAGGAAGDIHITAGELQVLDGAEISSATFGQGAGGSIFVTADTILVAGLQGGQDMFSSSIGAASDSLTIGGNAGAVVLNAAAIGVFDGGEINNQTTSSGNAGPITITARNLQLDNGSGLISSSTGSGQASTLSITLGNFLTMTRQSVISTSANISSGGAIDIMAGGSITLSGGSSITAQAGGEGGTIDIVCPGRIDLINSEFLTNAGNNGGDMIVDPSFVILEDSTLSANGENNGGNITVRPNWLLESQSNITATGMRGVGGTLQITPDYNLTGALLSLPVSLSDSLTLQPECAADLPGAISSFIVTGRGGAPIQPGGWMPDLDLRLPPGK